MLAISLRYLRCLFKSKRIHDRDRIINWNMKRLRYVRYSIFVHDRDREVIDVYKKRSMR